MLRDTEMRKMQQETELFIQYAVPEEMRKQAVALIVNYREDQQAMRLLHEFYRSLPEAREEPVIKLVQVDSHQGVLLLGAITINYAYLYLVTPAEVIFLGEKGEEIEHDVVSFFGYTDKDELSKACQNLADREIYQSVDHAKKILCPICLVFEGELHQLGCPVEVCPWCDGQLHRCNCRFDQLGVEVISDEKEILQFQQLLAARGRIRFTREQAPAYPSAGDPEEEQAATKNK